MKNSKLLLVALSLSIFLFGGFPTTLSAQPDTYGSIDFGETKRREKTYTDVQKGAIEFFEDAEATAGSGRSKPLRNLDEKEINYLAAATLYCALKQGICPFVVDAIMEIDVFNSALASKTSCPNTKQLWKAWVQADMEKRLDYGIGIGLMTKVREFRKNRRPYYLKCDSSIQQIRDSSDSSGALLAARYGEGKPGTKYFAKLARFLKALRDKKIDGQSFNVFIETRTK